MANAVIYARFSSSKQREESIEDQVRVCRDAADRAGDKIIKIYADSALSGRTDDRPQFQRMIADSEKGLFQAVYIYKTDRFARNRYDSAVNKAKLRKNGVRVITAAEAIPEGADGILMEAVLEGMAEYYSAQLAQNIKRGIEGNAQKCKANGHVVYGYDINKDGYYVINQTEAKVVLQMFEAFDSTGSIKEAVTAAYPSKTRAGNKWSIATVSRMLRNERYMGVYNYAGYKKEDGMPAIVSKELFGSVQAKFKNKHHGHSKTNSKYLLSGILFDWQNNPYTGTSGTSATGKTYYYYVCKNTKHKIKRDDLETAVAECCSQELSRPGIIEYITDLILEAQAKAEGEEAARLEKYTKALERNRAQYSNALDIAVNLGLNDDLKTKLTELESERSELEVIIAEEKRGAPVITREMIEFWVYKITEALNSDVLLSTFISRVIYQEDQTLHIVFLIDQMQDATWPAPKQDKYPDDNSSCAITAAPPTAHTRTISQIADSFDTNYEHFLTTICNHSNSIFGLPNGFVLIAA